MKIDHHLKMGTLKAVILQCHDFKGFPVSDSIIKAAQEHGWFITGMHQGKNAYGWECEIQMLPGKKAHGRSRVVHMAH